MVLEKKLAYLFNKKKTFIRCEEYKDNSCDSSA